MCIAIVTTAGKTISDEVFQRCWRNNRDGFGMAWVNAKDGKVLIDKGWMAPEAALRKYRKIAEDEKNADRFMLLHFRAATVGKVTQDNCHPFPVKGGAMIHNGTFFHDANATKSDSQLLAETMHNELHVANVQGHKEQLQKAFGYNRVAFLFNDNKIAIFSEEYNGRGGQFGQWADGVWYSNGGWAGQYNGYYGDDMQKRQGALQRDILDDQDQYDAWLLGRGNTYRAG